MFQELTVKENCLYSNNFVANLIKMHHFRSEGLAAAALHLQHLAAHLSLTNLLLHTDLGPTLIHPY